MKQNILSIAGGLVFLAAAPIAGAIPIDLGQTTGSPAGPSDEVTRLNDQISAYNLDNNPSLPVGTLTDSPGQVAGSGVSITLDVTGWDYVLLKWADTDQFYYVGNSTGDLTFDSTVFNGNGDPQALSHYEFFNPVSDAAVPDGGSTVMLLGASVSGLGLMVRRLKR